MYIIVIANTKINIIVYDARNEKKIRLNTYHCMSKCASSTARTQTPFAYIGFSTNILLNSGKSLIVSGDTRMTLYVPSSRRIASSAESC